MIPLPPDVVDALRKGNKIEAIKRLREATKIGLAEAKGVIDALEAAQKGQSPPSAPAAPHAPRGMQVSHAPHVPRHTGRPTGLSPGEVPRTSSGAMAAVIVLLV